MYKRLEHVEGMRGAETSRRRQVTGSGGSEGGGAERKADTANSGWRTRHHGMVANIPRTASSYILGRDRAGVMSIKGDRCALRVKGMGSVHQGIERERERLCRPETRKSFSKWTESGEGSIKHFFVHYRFFVLPGQIAAGTAQAKRSYPRPS